MKYIIPAFFLLLHIESFGQFAKKDKVLGATFSLDIHHPKNSNDKASAFNVTPTFGFLLTKNLEIGALVGYSAGRLERTQTPMFSVWKSNRLSLGAYTQRYFTI